MHVPDWLVEVLTAPQFACHTTSFFRASTLSFSSVQQILNTFCVHFWPRPPPPLVAWVRGRMVEAGAEVCGWGWRCVGGGMEVCGGGGVWVEGRRLTVHSS